MLHAQTVELSVVSEMGLQSFKPYYYDIEQNQPLTGWQVCAIISRHDWSSQW